jgi:ribosomal protein S19E (S16A)
MSWLGKSWIAYPRAGVTYEVNGKRLCTLATLTALEKAGLLVKVENNGYTATEAGRTLTSERHL